MIGGMIVKSVKLRVALSAAAAFLAVTSTTALTAAPAYRLTKLAPAGTSNSSAARAISANGNIVGEGFPSINATGQTAISYGNVSALASVYLPSIANPTTTFVRGVNNSGVAAGTAQDATTGGFVPILTSTGGLTVLTPISGYNNGGATGINNSGGVVGYSLVTGAFAGEGTARPRPGALTQQATIWNGGVASALANPFGNFNSLATAINASGQVAGVANKGASQATSRAVIWNGGVATELAVGANQRSTARSISSIGSVAGRRDSLLDGTYIGSVWAAGGSQYDLAAVGAGCDVSDLRGINASGTAVGFSQTSSATCGVNGTIGTLWQFNGSSYTGFDINSLVINLGGWNLFAPQGINDNGQIVGFGFDEFGNNRGFLLTAVPEPATWAMLIGGFGLTGAAMRRRRSVAA